MYVGKTTKLTKTKRNIMTLALVSDTRATASLWHVDHLHGWSFLL